MCVKGKVQGGWWWQGEGGRQKRHTSKIGMRRDMSLVQFLHCSTTCSYLKKGRKGKEKGKNKKW